MAEFDQLSTGKPQPSSTSGARRTSLEDAFDSDESCWSELEHSDEESIDGRNPENKKPQLRSLPHQDDISISSALANTISEANSPSTLYEADVKEPKYSATVSATKSPILPNLGRENAELEKEELNFTKEDANVKSQKFYYTKWDDPLQNIEDVDKRQTDEDGNWDDKEYDYVVGNSNSQATNTVLPLEIGVSPIRLPAKAGEAGSIIFKQTPAAGWTTSESISEKDDRSDNGSEPDNNNVGPIDEDIPYKHDFIEDPPAPLEGSVVTGSPHQMEQTSPKDLLINRPDSPKPSSSSSSSKKFFPRFLSSDNQTTSKQSFMRSSSLPTPLSELILDTPSKLVSFSIDEPPTNSTEDENVEVKESLPDIPISVGSKHKGFVQKLKKTFRVGSSKGQKEKSKQKPSPSSHSPNVTAAISDPCLVITQNKQTDDNPRSQTQTVGTLTSQPNFEVLMDRLRKANNAYLENTFRAMEGTNDGHLSLEGARPEPRSFHPADVTRQLSRANMNSISSDPNSNPSQDHREIRNTEGNGNVRSRNMPYYCDQAVDNAPNRKIIYKLLQEFQCVIEKSFGDSDMLLNNCESLSGDLEQLRAEIQCYETVKAELERKIQELTHDNQELQLCLEEQCQLRGDLENIVAQLKEQIARQDEIINRLTEEKSDLLSMTKQLEVDMGRYKNQIFDLETEREDLSRGMKGFEMSRTKCVDLQSALAECCERCDSLQKENFDLRQETRDLEGKLDTAFFEKNKVLTEIECTKQKFQEEKDGLEAQLSRLLEDQATFGQQKADMCRKLNESVNAHHDELDRLRNEADMYHSQLEKERGKKEDLARRLREGADNRRASATSMLATGPCAELRRQLSLANEKAQKLQGLYEREASERKQLEKQLRSRENENYDLQARVNVVGTRRSKEFTAERARPPTVGRSPTPERRRSKGSQSGANDTTNYF